MLRRQFLWIIELNQGLLWEELSVFSILSIFAFSDLNSKGCDRSGGITNVNEQWTTAEISKLCI